MHAADESGAPPEREAVRHDAQAQLGILRIQQEIGLSDTLDLPAVMHLMAERARELLHAEGGGIELLEDDTFVCRATAGTTVVPIGAYSAVEGSLASLAMREGTALYSEDAENDPRVNQALARSVCARSIIVTPLRVGTRPVGVLRLSSSRRQAFTVRDVAHVQILAETFGAVIERRRLIERLKASEAQYRLLFENNPHPMWVLRPADQRFLAVNRAALVHYGYSHREFLALDVDDLWVRESLASPEDNRRNIAQNRKAFSLHQRHRRHDGTVIDVELSADAIEFDGQPARLVLAYDVTHRLQAEREVARLNRAQRMLSACNEALIRAEAEPALLQRVCRVAVEIGGYRMAWVGFAHDDELHSIAPAAHAGAEDGFLAHVALSWNPGMPGGPGVVERTVIEGRTFVVEDLARDDRVRRWRERSLRFGYRGLVALPLKEGERCFGALALYADEVRQVSTEEVALLEEMANDLAFGIVNLRARDQQRRLQAAVLGVAASVSAHSGLAFFDQLVRHMAEAVGAQAGFVAQFEAQEPAHAHTIAGTVDGAAAHNFRFRLAGTPCAVLRESELSVIASRLAEQFPRAPRPMRIGAQAFVGVRLHDAAGVPIGVLFVLFREPLAETRFTTSTLQIFAARASAELERQASDARLQKLAFFDALTGLPNRQLLTERLQRAVDAAGREGWFGALLFVGLDDFKTLNDTLGHDKGDLLLRQVAFRLGSCVGASDTVARFGGDEFLIMLNGLAGESAAARRQAQAAGEKILAALRHPYRLDDAEHRSTASIGVAIFDASAGSVGELLRQTDLALHEAKALGRNTLCFFDPLMQQAVTERARLEADLRFALARSDFMLHYQPQAGPGGRVTGFEALLRWPHPQRGMVSPAVFIPLAEETGLILELGRWVLETACEQLARWHLVPAMAGFSVAVNVSSRQFHHSGFVDLVLDVLARTGAAPERLKLELTESLLVQDIEAVTGKMAALKARGVSFSLDDFGTGYSSLAYLKRLLLDQLKIDQSFVRDVLADPNDAAIAQTIIALGRSLGLEVIAEGVETEQQRALLAARGCHAYQGYLLSPPLPAAELPALLARLEGSA